MPVCEPPEDHEVPCALGGTDAVRSRLVIIDLCWWKMTEIPRSLSVFVAALVYDASAGWKYHE